MASEPKEWNTPEGAVRVFLIYYREMCRRDFNLSDKTILNIGPGNLIGLDLIFLLLGAKRVLSLDLEPGNYQYPEISDQLPFYHALWTCLQDEGLTDKHVAWPEAILRQDPQGAVLNQKRLLRLAPADLCALPVRNESVDFSFSNAVLEHIADPARAIAEIARTLAPGGHTMHRVDLRDHADFTQPLRFLQPGAPTHGCNLWRAHQFEAAFDGKPLRTDTFEVFDTCTVNDAQKSAFKSEFAQLPNVELGKLRFMVYALKI